MRAFYFYDCFMLVGAGLVVAGVAMRFGAWAGLVCAGMLAMGLTRLAVAR